MTGLELLGQTVLVIGGARGLGAGIAVALARAGAHVGITSRRQDAANRAAEALNVKLGSEQVIGVGLDVTRVQEMRKVLGDFAAQAGRLDVLVNSAGTAVTRRALELEESEWNSVLDTNLKGAFFASQAAAGVMKEQGGGRVINIASVLGFVVRGSLSPYSASKAALIHLTRSLAYEWARYSILVNAVAPGYVLTDMNREVLSQPAVMDRLISETPLRRLTSIEDVAGTVFYLCSPAATAMTGQTLAVDGGWTLA